ncbi:MAG: hypothetical protein WC538_14920 [Thermoanaerobaculia bacterium]|jgi:hypothetical protein
MPAPRRSAVRALAHFAGIVILASCGSLSPHKQLSTTLNEKSTGDVELSASEVRNRIDALVPLFTGIIEAAADGIRTESHDPIVRRRALEWKLESAEALQLAAFQNDLAAAGLDVWLLTVQMDDSFSTGVAATWFGEQQPIAREASGRLRAITERYAAELARDKNAFESAKRVIHDTAARYPVDAHISRRASIAAILGSFEGETAIGSMGTVRGMADSVATISDHLNAYMTSVPKMARWQAEMVTGDMAADLELASTLREFRAAATMLQQADALSPDAIDRALAQSHEVIRAERIAMLREIDRQRLETLRTISGERVELVKAIALERQAAFDTLHQERLDTIASVEQMRRDLIVESARQLSTVVDHLVLRVAQLVAAAGLCALIVVVILRRIPRA